MRLQAFAVATLAAGVACGEPLGVYPTAGEEPRADPAWVTGDAARALDAEHRFVLEPPILRPPFVPIERAREQSEIFARVVAGNGLLSELVIQDRDRRVPTFSMLAACQRTFFVQSQFRLIPGARPTRSDGAVVHDDEVIPESILRMYADHWLVPLCGPFGFEMTVEVSVAENPLTFQAWQTTYPSSMILAYYPRGVPYLSSTPVPLSVEQAVGFAHVATGKRIAGVPSLVHRGSIDREFASQPAGTARFCNRWRLTMEHPVRLRGELTGLVVTSTDVYVSTRTCNGIDARAEFHLPMPVRASRAFVTWNAPYIPPGPLVSYRLPLDVVLPAQFEPAVVVPDA